MQCFLVVVTDSPLFEIPDRFAGKKHVKLSGEHACIVADDAATTEEIAKLFKVNAGAEGGYRGIVVELDKYSGSENKEVVARFAEMREL